ncbi:MAG: acetyl-CoA carboxylase carboxyltransferase subunit beta [Rhizobiaceae bacterium]|nr:acetyl-CoA carboxylase carboxyltransferase subunit beta [Rhizobiaceae bacterium]
MNWITNFVRPKIGSLLNRADMPENLWIKCPESGEMVFYKDLEKNMGVIPVSGYHMRITAVERLKQFFDDGEYELFENPTVAIDPLKFRDKTRYVDKLKDARRKTETEDSILAASGLVFGIKMIAVVHEMSFIGGSLGMAAGETIVNAMQKAAEEKCALALFAASGGARMQEGIFSLMQMPRTTIARQVMRDAGAPYIVVLTNPTTGGVSASYAMLGDIHIAEPGAVIGFAGRRVIEQTIREKLPEDFQTSEYLLEHGMVDMIVERSELKPTISRIVRMMLDLPAAEIVVEEPEEEDAPDESDTSPEVEPAETPVSEDELIPADNQDS